MTIASTTAARTTGAFLLAGLTAVAWILGHGGAPVAATMELPASSAAYGFAFTEVSRECGVDFVHRAPTFDSKIENVMPDIASMGASVSVADVNEDGWPDLYFTNSAFGEKNALFINRKDGTFVDRAPEAAIADLNRPGEGVSMGSIWGDIDNDGHEDLYVYKYGYPQLFRSNGPAEGGVPTFTDITAAAGVRNWINANTACWIDYDRDGLLDLFTGGYFRESTDLWHLKDTRFRQESMDFANNGGRKYLYKNMGNGRFKDVTGEMGVQSTRWLLAVSSADFNGDGWPDLYLANDYGVEILFLNDEGKKFREAKNAGLSETSKSGMCVAIGDCANTGNLDVYVSNITKAGFMAQGNNLRVNRLKRSARFDNMAHGDTADCGWAWGSQFADFNHDGYQDLIVVNGYISASREHDYWYDMARVAGGAGNLIEDSANWAPFGDKSLSGYERSRLLLNDGQGDFTDVAPRVGITDLLDGRGVAVADLFRRGALDIIVANQKDRVLIYKNHVDPARHWVQFQLKATRSNRSAINASVLLEWTADGLRHCQRRIVDGGCGFASQNERKIHFGLGAGARDLQATVRWPSGAEQVVRDLAPDRVHEITEP